MLHLNRYVLAVQTEMIRNAYFFRHRVLFSSCQHMEFGSSGYCSRSTSLLPVQCTVARRTSFPTRGLPGLLSMTWTICATLMRIAPLLFCDRARGTKSHVARSRLSLTTGTSFQLSFLHRRRVARHSCCATYRTTIRGRCCWKCLTPKDCLNGTIFVYLPMDFKSCASFGYPCPPVSMHWLLNPPADLRVLVSSSSVDPPPSPATAESGRGGVGGATAAAC